MPHNAEVSEADLAALEDGGGLAKRTVKDRAKHFDDFNLYVKDQSGGKDIKNLMGEGAGDKAKEGQESVVKHLGKYFFTMRVTIDGTEMWPKKAYAEKVRSNIKMSILEEYKIDITDKGLFPTGAKNWKSFCEKLVKEGRSETSHHPEVDPETMEAINALGMAVKDALESRGTEQYEEKLNKIPVQLRDKLNYIIQWIAMFQLILFECRRGGENIQDLKKKDFVVFKDPIKNFEYIKHVKTEKDKNHSEGTNSSCYGCIPFLDFSSNFNPGEIFSFYLQFLPDQPTKAGVEGGYLFPRPRAKSSKFDPHNPTEMCLFEPNQKGLLNTQSRRIF